MALPWILATRNAGKLRELRALFVTSGIGAIDLREAGVEEEVAREASVEAFDTFEENALAKVRYFSSRLPGRVLIADDSGLTVDALGGAPGVRSKRWSGRTDLSGRSLDAANNRHLLSALEHIPGRTARFVCAAAWSDGRSEFVTRGEVEGRVVDVPRGEHGFGYDPLVFVNDIGKTLAEATLAEKGLVSHRGRAFTRLLALLRDRGLADASWGGRAG